MTIKNFNDIFDENGNFIKPFDPYRSDDNKLRKYLFDKDGYAKHTEEARLFILKNNCSPFSDVVKYYYSSMIDRGCKGNYTAIYAWR